MKFIKAIINFFDKINADHIGEYTAQCAYYTFLSFIPFIILLLGFIKYVNIDKETLVDIFEAILPSIMKNSVLDIIQEMYSKSIETISLSAIFMLWSTSKSFYALNKGLLAIYKREEGENFFFLRLKSLVGAVVALIIIILILVLLVFGNSIEIAINENFNNFSNFFSFIFNARGFISIIGMFIIFLFLYRISPKKKGKRVKHCILGAAFTSIACYLISFFFSIYVNIFTNFSIIYGSLATITLIMMWLYTIIYVILLGAEINYITEDKINNLCAKFKNKRQKVKLLRDNF